MARADQYKPNTRHNLYQNWSLLPDIIKFNRQREPTNVWHTSQSINYKIHNQGMCKIYFYENKPQQGPLT